MRVVRLSWAGVQISAGEATLVIDLLENTAPLRPLLGDPPSPILPAYESLYLALVTHLHPDHYDPSTLRSKLKPDAKVLCDRANVSKIAGDGFLAVAAGINEPISADPFTVTALPAVDGFEDQQISFLVEAGGVKTVSPPI
jgi:L-ascorbate metabolism protein UlaG (beta-lactamase superfamily)